MRALRILVVVMGVMIIVGFAVVIAVVAGRLSHRGSVAGTVRPFADTSVAIPRGARIEAMTIGADRLILELVLPDSGRQLVVIDLATGTRLGTIDLRAAP